MYSRRLGQGEEAARFGVSGKLWNGVLVMFDRDTESLWTQLDGRALLGEHEGKRLEHVASTFTTWARWKAAHPGTLVLERSLDSLEEEGSAYADYFADPDRLFRPELAEGLGGIAPKDVVFGVFEGGDAWAVEESVLERDGVVNLVVGTRPLALLRSAENGFVRAVERVHGDRILVLAPAPGADVLTTVRDARSGATLPTSELPRVRFDRAFWYAWARSHPGSRILAD